MKFQLLGVILLFNLTINAISTNAFPVDAKGKSEKEPQNGITYEKRSLFGGGGGSLGSSNQGGAFRADKDRGVSFFGTGFSNKDPFGFHSGDFNKPL